MGDWANLAFDALEYITSFLPLSDCHRFSAVCKNWRSVAKRKRHPPAPQPPWLVLGEDIKTRQRRFYSLSEERHYSIDIPELYGRYIYGSSHGWMFAVDIRITGILINPFTRESYELPQFPPYDDVDVTKLLPSDSSEGPRDYTPEEMQVLIVGKGILSQDPKKRSDFTALILFGKKNSPAIWRPGDSCWTVIKCPQYAMMDATFHNGNFYVISANNKLHVVDLGSEPKMIKIKPRIMPRVSAHKYLVAFNGCLLHIERLRKEIEPQHFINEEFELLEPDLQEKEIYSYNHIDGVAIFLGVNSPIVIDASQFPGCKENAIYFTDLSFSYSAKKFGYSDLGIFDYIDKTSSAYYSPQVVHPHVGAPVWIIPNPW